MTLAPLPLPADWTLRASGGPAPEDVATATVAATVPGCAHTDLLAAGLIPDPFLDDNESATAWIGLVDWRYETTFTWNADAAQRHDLAFAGLDTVAEITLNDRTIGATENQHRSYRFEVSDALVEGENTLVVQFRSPVRHANARSVELGARERPYPLPYEAIRKSACSFGWDWGIATATSGIVAPVTLEAWSIARLQEVRVVAAVDQSDAGTVTVDATLERADEAPVAVRVTAAGTTIEVPVAGTDTTAHAVVHLDGVERWWPVGYGAQPLTDVLVELVDADGAVLDTRARRVGFRDVHWDTTPDAAGTPFTLVVNGLPIFVKGANWIPDDALTVRITRERLRRRLTQAVDGNLNLIRVWGGGLYESDDFYDLCDELGLLTWQDFLFACAAYPEEEPIRSEVEAEARENIVRLAHHASLVLLTGNNENLWGFEDWGWKQRLDGKTWGAYYYYDLFPRLVDELAPQVPYAPGSPFSPGGQHPNDEAHGTMHLWEQWNRLDWLTYRDHRPRFVAEFGWQGPPAWTTLTESLSDAPLTPESPGMIVHQKAMEGNVKLTGGLVPHFRKPEQMRAWHWAMQLNQATAVRTALEHFRSHSPHTMGAIVWQLNDCWPVTSWAAIDGAERPKPLFHALRSAFAPRLVTIQPREGGLAAVLVNELRESWTGALELRRLRFDGTVLASETVDVDVAAGGTSTIDLPDSIRQSGDATAELVTATLGGIRGEWFFAEPRDSALEAARVQVSASPTAEGSLVTITADNLVRDLTLLVDVAASDATVLDGLRTLLPGESTTLAVRHGGVVAADAFAHADVLRTANELVVS
ncbi:glycoside hydrolase family 2 protein [Microbacterium sp. NPDC089189]|uniref:glycoside hydrolase family 2 protein n=1 Tax=Microbacterium sp. NPDC089189 TaxID=3154972 RepID=UPI003433D867